MRTPDSLAIVTCLVAALWALPAVAQTITDLGALGGRGSSASGINASGQVVGAYLGPSGQTAFLYSNGVMTGIGSLGCSGAEVFASASGINESGQVVGSESGTIPIGCGGPFLYFGGITTNLNSLLPANSGWVLGAASAINDSGQIVGVGVVAGGANHAFLYSGGSITDLGTLPGDAQSGAAAINDSGEVVGSSSSADGSVNHAFLYSGGIMTDLGTLGGCCSSATGINASGQVVGSSTTASGDTHAFLYSGGIMTDLGTLGESTPGYSIWANGINASGQIVGGFSSADGSVNHAFLYSGGVMTDLNSLLPANSAWVALVLASAINDSGQIVGNGTTTLGCSPPYWSCPVTHGFLLDTEGPTITSLSPSSTAAGGATFTLTVNGTYLFSGATVNWNGIPLATAFVGTSQLTATVPASLIATPGTATVSVTTIRGTSLGATFTMKNVPPTIASISPSSAMAGGPAFPLRVTGTNFFSSATVKWNGTPLPTLYVSANTLEAAVPASLITTPGTASVIVTTILGTSVAATFTINPVAPTITSLSPSSATVGGPAFPLTVTGTNFIPGTTVNWNGTALSTLFVSANTLEAAVPASLIATAGTASVTVTTDGVTSAGTIFTVELAPPTITGLSPNAAKAGSAALTLTISGTNFVPGAAAKWNGAGLTTSFVSAAKITAAVPASDLATPGTASVTVTTTGGTSPGTTFTINPGAPKITSLSPKSATAGGAAFNLTVTGTNFVAPAKVNWNGVALQTIPGSGTTSLTAVVPASDIATVGTASVTVTTSGGTSAGATFTINPHPTITSLSPSSTTAGGAAFTLTINGTGFVPGATVTFGNAALTTTFVSATKLTAAVPALYFGKAGAVSVVVYNPGRITSNTASFTVH